MTLVEILIAAGLGSLVLAAVTSMSWYGARSSAAMVNYVDLDSKSRYALDVIGREVRQASAVVAFQTNLPIKSLTLTNAEQGAQIVLTWDANARTLVMDKTGQDTFRALTACDSLDFSLCQRTPLVTLTNVTFYPATNRLGAIDLSVCKVINLTWKCSRTIQAPQLNTESVKTAQIVLRNKQ